MCPSRRRRLAKRCGRLELAPDDKSTRYPNWVYRFVDRERVYSQQLLDAVGIVGIDRRNIGVMEAGCGLCGDGHAACPPNLERELRRASGSHPRPPEFRLRFPPVSAACIPEAASN